MKGTDRERGRPTGQDDSRATARDFGTQPMGYPLSERGAFRSSLFMEIDVPKIGPDALLPKGRNYG